MSKKKVVRISESGLVDLIDNIVSEAVAEKKKQWVSENKKSNKNSILESRIKKLESKINKINGSK